MKREKIEEKTIEGNTFVINRVSKMEYSGEWEVRGYEAIVNGHSYIFIGYPTDGDLKRFAKSLTEAKKSV